MSKERKTEDKDKALHIGGVSVSNFPTEDEIIETILNCVDIRGITTGIFNTEPFVSSIFLFLNNFLIKFIVLFFLFGTKHTQTVGGH